MVLLTSGSPLGKYTTIGFSAVLLLLTGFVVIESLVCRRFDRLSTLFRPPLAWLVALLCWSLLLGVVGVHPIGSAILAFKMLGLLACIAFTHSEALADRRCWRWFKVYSLAVAVSGVIALVRPGSVGIGGLYSNPNQLGQQLMLALVCSLSIVAQSRAEGGLLRGAVLWIALCSGLTGMLIASTCRAALGGAAAAVLWMWSSKKHVRLLYRRLSVLRVTTTVLLVAVLLLAAAFAWGRLPASRFPHFALSGRNELWQEALGIAMKDPLVGVGLGETGTHLHVAGVSSYAHNVFIDAFVEVGVPGLAVMVGLFISLAKMSSGLEGAYGYLVGAVALAFLVQQSFESTLLRLDPAFLFLTAMIALRPSKTRRNIKAFGGRRDG